MTVVDMRGGSARVVTDLSKLEKSASGLDAEELPFPELQHNLRLVVDLAGRSNRGPKIRHEKDTRNARGGGELEDATSAAASVATLLRDAEACEAAARNGTASLRTSLSRTRAWRSRTAVRRAWPARPGAEPRATGFVAADRRGLGPAGGPGRSAKATRVARVLTVPGPDRDARRVDAFAGSAGGPSDPIATLVSRPSRPVRAALVEMEPGRPRPALRVLGRGTSAPARRR